MVTNCKMLLEKYVCDATHTMATLFYLAYAAHTHTPGMCVEKFSRGENCKLMTEVSCILLSSLCFHLMSTMSNGNRTLSDPLISADHHNHSWYTEREKRDEGQGLSTGNNYCPLQQGGCLLLACMHGEAHHNCSDSLSVLSHYHTYLFISIILLLGNVCLLEVCHTSQRLNPLPPSWAVKPQRRYRDSGRAPSSRVSVWKQLGLLRQTVFFKLRVRTDTQPTNSKKNSQGTSANHFCLEPSTCNLSLLME